MSYPNVSQAIGMVVTSRLATAYELQTVFGVEDLQNFLEMLQVNAHNQQIANERAARKQAG